MKRENIADTLRQDGRFTTLLAALDAAGLTEALEGNAKLTLCAPTDEAFAKLPDGTVAALLNDIPRLTAILTYHVAEKRQSSKRLLKKVFTPTLNGSNIFVTAEGGGVFINRSEVGEADIKAKNGIIHVMNDVILPPENSVTGTGFVDALILDGRFQTLLTAVGAAGLTDLVNDASRAVLCAPTDEAFAKLPAGTVEALLNDIPQLIDILSFHVSGTKRGKVKKMSKKPVETLLAGETWDVSLDGGDATVNDVNIIRSDVRTSNGFLQTIDEVLLPPAGQ